MPVRYDPRRMPLHLRSKARPSELFTVHSEHDLIQYHASDYNPNIAFQAAIPFDVKEDLNEHMIQKHLDEHDKSVSSFISAYDNAEKATAIANSLSNATPHASQIIIASVKTSDLVPRAFYPDRSGPALPIWLNKSDMPETSMTDDECSKRCVTIWISVEEVSHHLPRYIGREYDDEWLACGHMLWKDIESVMPYDGVRLYKSPPNRTVRSGGWIFDWGGRRWRLEIASQTLDMIEDGTTETMHDIEKLSDDNEGAKSHTEDLANNHTDELPDTSTIDPSTTGSEHSTTPPSSDLAHLIELCDGTIEALQVCSSQLSELFSAFSMADDRTPDIDAVTTQLRNMNAAVGLVKVVLIEGLSTRTDQDGTDRDLADQDETGGNGSR